MRLALNGATIMHSPIEDNVEIAAACGYTVLEIWAGKLGPYLRSHTLEQLGEHMRACRIAPWCINSIEDITYRGAAGRGALLEELRSMAAAARALGAPSIVVVPGPQPDGRSRSDAVRESVNVLRAMSDVAGDRGLAFEFLGKPGCAVPLLDMAVEIVGRVDRPNVGMVIDTFHFYAGGSRVEDIDAVAVEKLNVVHLNGCEDIRRAALTDAHRLYPGEGVIPIESILTALHARGYDGVASIEIFRPEYWEQDPREVARTAFERAGRVLAAAGYSVD